ncbi:MAG: amino acid adenylation domain-containing protein [Clostridia bacterium]|nr:amino acid adenylation domain-containing protein [Clostridia bacterium]
MKNLSKLDIFKKVANRELSKEEALMLLKEEQRLNNQNDTTDNLQSNKYPLCEGQKALWLIEHLTPGLYAYNLPGALWIDREVNIPALKSAISKCWQRHPSLRTVFMHNDMGLYQKVLEKPFTGFSEVSLTTDKESEMIEFVRAEARNSFDIENGPLMRATLFKPSKGDYILLINFHHIVFDGISSLIFINELIEQYSALIEGRSPKLLPLEATYAQFVQQQQSFLQSEKGMGEKDYWLHQMEGYNPPLELCISKSRPANFTFKGSRHTLKLNSVLARKLEEFSLNSGINVFTVMLCAYSLLLHIYSSREDIVVGVPVAGRNLSKFENVIGYFINMLPLRSNFSGDITYKELLQKSQNDFMEALQYSEYPYYSLVQEWRKNSGITDKELVNVSFYFQNWLKSPKMQQNAFIKGVVPEIGQEGEFDLTLEVLHEDDITLNFKFNPDIFEIEAIQQIAAHYGNILTDIVDCQNKMISQAALMTEEEKNTTLVQWNNTVRSYPKEARVCDLFEARTAQSPESIAVVFGQTCMTYKELNHKADMLAASLSKSGVSSGCPIGVFMRRSADMLVALIGIFKAGGAYVPLDPGYPKERLDYIIKDSGIPVLLSESSLEERWSLLSLPVILMDKNMECTQKVLELDKKAISEEYKELAYIIHTSGSTGKPKGVAVGHQGLTNFLLSMAEQPGCTQKDYFLALTTICFDISTLELFLPLVTGGTVEILTESIIRDGIRLKEAIEGSKATIVQATPATWKMLQLAGWSNSKPIKILCGGEALSRELADFLLKDGEREVWNLYGPTETTVWSTVQKLTPGGKILIGRPIWNTECHILNSHMQPVPVGVAGDLYIGGDGLAKGYLNLPELTRDRFIPHPFGQPGERLYKTGDLARYTSDGMIEFVGRSDQQIKLHGFRIELGEIETALQKVEGIDAAIASVRKDSNGSASLVAFIVSDDSKKQDTALVKEKLGRWLPAYMIPSRIVYLKSFPMTLNKKVDRTTLSKMDIDEIITMYGGATSSNSGTAAESVQKNPVLSRLQKDLIGIVARVRGLNIDEIESTAHLGDYGFDSLKFTELSVAINNTYGIKIYPTAFYQYSDAKTLADYIKEKFKDEIDLYYKDTLKTDTLDSTSNKLEVKDNTDTGLSELSSIKNQPVAIVGASAMLPGSPDLETFWDNLISGKDLVREIPDNRWSIEGIADLPDFPRWGGFLDEVDKFDPAFFGISPREAELMDPQQRLFLEMSWKAIEDSGHKASELAGTRTGVYVGISSTDYEEKLGHSIDDIEAYSLTGMARTIIANRVSYLLNLKGPSGTIDTACSSSLVAIHRAVRAIQQGECEMALAGGANLIISAVANIAFSKNGMTSKDGRCKTFDKSANGYVRGEGVAVVFLKPLSKAIEDRDHVYGIILGSAENHGGRTNSLTAPNSNAQAELIEEAYERAGIEPADVTYIETHGTGTPLGDPVEINGLKAGFEKFYGKRGGAMPHKPVCGLGSVKTNVGHLEAAAGVTGLLKVLMSIKYRKIPANLHLKEINPFIELDNTPFYIVSEARDWEPLTDEVGRRLPLRAGVSSFGMGGSNAHIVLEEYIDSEENMSSKPHLPNIFVLSAKNAVQLKEYAGAFVKFMEKSSKLSQEAYMLDLLAYTLQVGREAMKERLAVVYGSFSELLDRLTGYHSGKASIEGVFSGKIKNTSNMDSIIFDNKEGTDFVKKLFSTGNTNKLAQLWVDGMEIDWSLLYEGVKPRRISIPTYPFARESYWIDRSQKVEEGFGTISALTALIDSNESTLEEQCFKKRLYKDEFFLKHHIVGGKIILPGVVYIEMLRMAGELASKKAAIGQIRNIVWAQPVVVDSNYKDIFIKIYPSKSAVEFQVVSIDDGGQSVVHSYGSLVYGAMEKQRIDLEQLKKKFVHSIQGDEFYKVFPKAGFDYGATFQAIHEVYYTGEEALSFLRVKDSIKEATAGLLLHPSLMEGALQTAVGLLADGTEDKNEPYLPFSMGEVNIFGPMNSEMYVYAVQKGKTASSHGKSRTFDILIMEANGNVAVSINNYVLHTVKLGEAFVRQELQEEDYGTLFYKADWNPCQLEKGENSGHVHGATLLFENNDSNHVANFDRESSVIVIHEGNDYCKLRDDKYCINPSNSEHYKHLVTELKTKGISNIIHGWSEGEFHCTEEQKSKAYIKSVLSVYNMAKALTTGGIGNEIKFIYTCSSGKKGNPLFGAVSSLLKTIAAENPKCRVKSIEFTDSIDMSLIADELLETGDWSPEVLYTGGQRHTRLFNEINMQKHDIGEAVFRDRGIYLITGGTGEIGFRVSRFLTENFKARLVLNSRNPLSDGQQARVRELEELGAEVLFVQGDISRAETAKELIKTVKGRFGTLNGIVHCAGITQDSLLARKSMEEFEAVLGPKLWGTLYLDEACAQEPIDFFMMFSSMSAVFGNIGQADYSYANSFMDKFALYREALRKEKLRHGRTVSINWPLWEEGGIRVDESYKAIYKESIGIGALSTSSGLDAMIRILESPYEQVVVLEGERGKIQHFFKKGLNKASNKTSNKTSSTVNGEVAEQGLKEHVLKDLIKISSDILKINPEKIDYMEDMPQYGYDSLSFMDLSREINKTFGMDITPAVFFEYSTLEALAEYLCKHEGKKLNSLYSQKLESKRNKSAESVSSFRLGKPITAYTVSKRQEVACNEPIAIIGMYGVMPGSDNLEEFWNHILCERNLVTEIPSDRWNWREYYGDPMSDGNKTNSRWGAFLKEVDKFDASFFGISPKEAKVMDPQQRIFLEVLWSTIEDAGYRVADLSQKRVGVFVGVSNSDYTDLLKEAGEEIDVHGMIGNGHPYLANRVSFLLNLTGPSEPIDTLCSSSLVSIHRAIESIRSGSSEVAIAGGINIILKPTLNIFFSKAGMLSTEGMCKTFDKEANGFVRGEGAGAVLLKPLSKAVEDGDRIYAVIKGSAVNHGGRSNTITAPNTAAQTDVIIRALEEAQIDPGTVGYIEAHGTGTALGDPVEVTALTRAFETIMNKRKSEYTEKNFCALGSVKTNIGHLESAAGIAGLIKVLLSMKNGIIPANLHFNELNPFIKIQDSPFYIAEKMEEWERSRDSFGNIIPRRAGVSSFGAGGVNAHIVLEEYCQPDQKEYMDEPCIVTLSAKTPESLEEYAKRLLTHLYRSKDIRLTDIAYTLQMGREPMRYRLAVVVSDIDELKKLLESFVQNSGRKDVSNLFCGDSAGENAAYTHFLKGDEGWEYIDNILRNKRYTNIAGLWANGVEFNWKVLYEDKEPMKLSLPVYPFKREKYWVHPGKKHMASRITALHPLLDKVLPAMPSKGTIFEKTLTYSDLVVSHHLVRDKMILPGVAHLEMAYAAIKLVDKDRNYKLSQVVWLSPIVLDGSDKSIHIVVKEVNGNLYFETYDHNGDGATIHSKGLYVLTENNPKDKRVNIQAILERCDMCINSDTLYQGFRSIGIHHDKYFRSVKEMRCNKEEALGILELPSEYSGEFEQYSLHPSILDSALQGMMSFIKGDGLEEKTMLPFMVEEVEVLKPISTKCYSYIRPTGRDRYNIALLDEEGLLCVRIFGVVLRELQRAQERMYYVPQWVRQDVQDIGGLHKSGVESILIIYPPEAGDVKDSLKELHSGDNIYGIKLGTRSYHESPWDWEVDVRCPEHMEGCIKGILNIDRVYFLGGLTGCHQNERADREKFIYSQEVGIYSLFRIVKILGNHNGLSSEFKFKAVVTGIYPEMDGNISRTFSAGIDGFLRVAAREYPKWQITCLDVDLQGLPIYKGQDLNLWLRHLYNEPAHKNSEAVSIRRGVRYVRILEPVDIPAVEEPMIRNGGVYIILGGTGGIGLKLAEFLAEKFKVRIALIGRKELSADRKNSIDRIKAKSAEVLYIRAEANDSESLKEAVEKVRLEYGVINGAFHSALELHDTSIDTMNDEEFRSVYDVKSVGCLNLWEALQNDNLDFLVFFSSVQSIFGGVGQANYVAGCTFEDALSLALKYKSSYPVKLINWGRWGKVGAVAGDEYDLRFKSQGVNSILPDEGIEAVMRVLSQPCSQVVVFKAEEQLIRKMGINNDTSQTFLPPHIPSLIKTLGAESRNRDNALNLQALQEPFTNLGRFCRMLLFSKLQEHLNGVTLEGLKRKLGVIPEYDKLFEELICILQRSEIINLECNTIYITPEALSGKLSHEVKKLPEIKEQIIEKYPSIRPHVLLLSEGLEYLVEILCGKVAATDILFPDGSNHLVAGVYQENPVADYFNGIVASKAADYVRQRLSYKPEKINILEVGAGTGSTTKLVLKALAPFSHTVRYLYTDISSAFIQHGRKTFAAEYPFVEFRTMDIEKTLQQQGMNIGEYDIVIAANVLHATKDIKATLSNVKALMKTNGLLILNEVTENDEFSTLTFGLLNGWWLYKDGESRLPGGPLLGTDLWKSLLQEEGFAPMIVKGIDVNQHVILAESDGRVRLVNNKAADNDSYKKPKANLNQVEPKTLHIIEKKAPAQIAVHKAQKSNVEDIISELVAKALDMEPQTVDRKRQFFEYGIDSINGVELVNKLSNIFSMELSKTIIFDYPSVNDMAAYIRSLLKEKSIG